MSRHASRIYLGFPTNRASKLNISQLYGGDEGEDWMGLMFSRAWAQSASKIVRSDISGDFSRASTMGGIVRQVITASDVRGPYEPHSGAVFNASQMKGPTK